MKPWLAVVVEIVWSSKKTLAGVAVMWYSRSSVLMHLLEHDQLWRLWGGLDTMQWTVVLLPCQTEKGKNMNSEIRWDIVEDSIARRLGGNPSYRLVRKLTGYAYNLLDSMRWPAVDSLDYERAINAVCNAAIVGSEEM